MINLRVGKRKDLEDRLQAQYLEEGEVPYIHERPQYVSQPKNRTWMEKEKAENSIIDLIDMKDAIRRMLPYFRKMDQKKLDVAGLFQGISPEMAKILTVLAFGADSEKVRADSAKTLLALAGHTPINKHAVAAVDPTQPREALISLIQGALSGSKEIEIVDDEAEDEDPTPGP